MTEERIITARDLQAKGFCLMGVRRWAHDNGFDFKDFLRNGMPKSKVAAIDDAMAERLIELVEQDEVGK
jgi:hypothetical protein